MNYIVHGVTKSQTPLSHFHFIQQTMYIFPGNAKKADNSRRKKGKYTYFEGKVNEVVCLLWS